jgi:hypothetical protein
MENFEIVLSKNRLAREIKQLYANLNEPVPTVVQFDFEEIERAIGTANQPTAKEIFNINANI